VQTAQLDLEPLCWPELAAPRDQAQEILSIGDLIDGSHGQTDVARRASLELEQIARVAACLYARFGNVLPRIRLDWAERLSQRPDIDLHNLSNLPRWSEIEYSSGSRCKRCPTGYQRASIRSGRCGGARERHRARGDPAGEPRTGQRDHRRRPAQARHREARLDGRSERSICRRCASACTP
jgi:hypothetical protein